MTHGTRMSRAEMDHIDSSLFARSLLSMGQTMSTANVIMQLANPAIGYGVARSTVESGRLDRHPVKRARTTASYLAVAAMGNADDRRRFRQAVNRQHAQVRSDADSPVEYNAMDPGLQLWVAACLYMGWEDIYTRVHGPLSGARREKFYQQGKVCAEPRCRCRPNSGRPIAMRSRPTGTSRPPACASTTRYANSCSA